MDYIYAKLNQRIAESQTSNFTPTQIENSDTISVKKFSENEFELNVNTSNLVRLNRVYSENDPSGDIIQRYRLLAYNKDTGMYDTSLGDDIVIAHNTISGGNVSNINSVSIAGQQIPAYIDSQGQMVIQYIPSVAISDQVQVTDQSGNVQYKQVESIIDGNDD